MFFIDSDSGRIATRRQLTVAGLANDDHPPPRPWHQIRAGVDASTLWHAVLRKQERGIWLGTLTFRHGDHHSLLLKQGWEEVDVDEIRAFGPAGPPGEDQDEALTEAVRAWGASLERGD